MNPGKNDKLKRRQYAKVLADDVEWGGGQQGHGETGGGAVAKQLSPTFVGDFVVKRHDDDDDPLDQQRPPSPNRGGHGHHVRHRLLEFVERPTFHRNLPRLPGRRTAEVLAVLATRALPALAVLLGLPFFAWDDRPEDWGLLNPYPMIRHVDLVWCSLVHMACWPIVLLAMILGAVVSNGGGSFGRGGEASAAVANNAPLRSQMKMSARLSVLLASAMVVSMWLQVGSPHILWNPFLWFRYRPYLPKAILPSLEGACLDAKDRGVADGRPLCLGEREWRELSSGQLSSRDPDDVLAVERGLDYLRNRSGGLIVNALARDVAESMPALRQNMDGLAALFKEPKKELTLVVFENDSKDGTRERFQSWADEETKYAIDLMSCGADNPNCALGIEDRYNANLFRNAKASGVGKLGEFRQIALEYILAEEEYKGRGHMMVLDVDLGVSISPLGLLHALGLEDDVALTRAVASSSSQIWPGTMGSILPPYDFSAFRPKPTTRNAKVRQMHKEFCELGPPGDRWRNMCEAASPMQLFMVTKANDASYHHGRPYEVESAFNGLTLYPMALLRERGRLARYDAGEDGQRCEHVGFHLSLSNDDKEGGTTMYVDPKWTMKLRPEKPGGPTGFQGVWTLFAAVARRPHLIASVVGGLFAFFFVLIGACAVLGASIGSLVGLAGPSAEAWRAPFGSARFGRT